MRIKRIEIIGFKSFQDKTVLHIDEPITAVVGPNGCGKSNIIDAIRWCMGEQSAKHLRGKAMDDVIFGGSETRSPAGMAEVSLTFENVGLSLQSRQEENELDGGDDDEPDLEPAGPPPIDFAQYGEVTVTRRLFRDGQSDYFLNKTPCRLRDITDFFLGTGVGTKAYSIIEQGRVGMIVSAKPEDRRLIIEEAAGITKFKKKKQAAERKMEQTRANLLRVNDVVSEIDKQLASLRRQAQKAERYKKYRAEVKDIELWMAAHRFLAIRAEQGLLQAELSELLDGREQADAAFQTAEAGVVAERAAAAVEERRLSDLTQEVFELENRVRLGESQIEFQGREAKDLEERVASWHGEIEGLARQREEAMVEAARLGAEAERLDGEAGARQAELARLEAELREAREGLAESSAELDAARAEIGKAQADIARAEGNTRNLDRRRLDLEHRAGRLAEEEARLAGRAAELQAEASGQEERLEGLKAERGEREGRRHDLEARRTRLDGEHRHAEAQVETLRTELHRRRSRLQSLREIQDRYEGFARGTRAVMKHRPGERIRGLLADVVQAPAEVEAAVEAILGERLGSVLVDDQQTGAEAVGFLKQRAEGRATFIPMGAIAAPQGGGVEVVEAEGVKGPMLGFVSLAEEHRGLGEVLFSDVLVVDSLSRALELWSAGVRRTMVTLDGDIVDRHGVVTGGSREAAGAGVLKQKREIRELEEISAGLDKDLEAASARLVSVKAELAETAATLETLRKEGHQGDLAILTSEKDLVRWRSEGERLAERRAQLERERGEVAGAQREHARELEENDLALAGARGRAGDAEKRQLGLIEGVTLARRDVDDATARVTEHKVRVAQVAAERQAARGQLARLEDGARELARRVEKLERSMGEGSERARSLRAQAEETAAELVGVREARGIKAEELAAGRGAHEARLAALQEAELEVRALRARLDKLSAEAGKRELRLGQLGSDRRHVEESVAERYRLEIAREVFDHHLRPPVGEEEERRLAELRELIERMGEINLTAIEEFEELSRRHQTLVAQKADLESALGQLERAIAKINKTSRRRFRETFDAVNAKFQEIFPRLFRGGRAELRLTGGDSDEQILDAGVEILAQPPGKKNSSVELLSGGEKALTAVSLIFAIFLIKPSPFCILDEVDAPLDEANVGRYNDMVREMTDRSQFIVITHNKRTMEIADSLFGITMEEPGCSKLVNVSLRTFGGERRAA
jgi:chromosome segregation protein